MNHHYNVKLGGRFLAVADLVWHAKKTLMLTRINVPAPYRGQGHASRLLKQILANADAEGITIHLHASSSGGLNEEQLILWYVRHGFIIKNCLIMERKPRSSYPGQTNDESPEAAMLPD